MTASKSVRGSAPSPKKEVKKEVGFVSLPSIGDADSQASFVSSKPSVAPSHAPSHAASHKSHRESEQQSEQAEEQPYIYFTGNPSDDQAKHFWANRKDESGIALGTPGPPRLPQAFSQRLPRAPNIEWIDPPSLVKKDWHFYKYHPSGSLHCSMNKNGLELWPGLNQVPDDRMHLVVRHPQGGRDVLPITTWSGYPRAGPGRASGFIRKKISKEEEDEEFRRYIFKYERQESKGRLKMRRAERQALESRTGLRVLVDDNGEEAPVGDDDHKSTTSSQGINSQAWQQHS